MAQDYRPVCHDNIWTFYVVCGSNVKKGTSTFSYFRSEKGHTTSSKPNSFKN